MKYEYQVLYVREGSIRDLNDLLQTGWEVFIVTPEYVASSSSSWQHGNVYFTIRKEIR